MNLHVASAGRRLLAIVIASLSLFFAASGNVRAAEEGIRDATPKLYGVPGPGKILVAITGQVVNPGRYYIERGTALSELSKIAGGLQKCRTCGNLPRVVTLSSPGNPSQKTDYALANPTALASVILSEDDEVRFWHYRL